MKSKLMFTLQHQTVLQSSQLEPLWQKELWGVEAGDGEWEGDARKETRALNKRIVNW